MAMSPEYWAQLKEMFVVAMEYDPPGRAAYLNQVCAGDHTLRAEIESLLASHEHAENFIEAPAFTGIVKAMTESSPEQVEGQPVGSYQLLREIGRGGMGTVFLAERADKQYKKVVAIKVVRRGMDTEDILRRFRIERQILASLEHPNIARLLDGGTTEDGLPFLVMEYVDGQPLMDYCRENRLTTEERLQLFRTICAAVQHAHQNLVVHRDLKPSNILVTTDGSPKLLDFGIAKVLSPEPSVLDAQHTRTELRILTPDYASPEQVRGEKLTTTSDVYSLGVMLYELLTGQRPHRSSSLAPHEIARAICEQEPIKPSIALSTNLKVTPPVNDRRQSTINGSEDINSAFEIRSNKLHRQLKGDLDNIILMAMRKDPARRYTSVGEFSEDIRRHLEGLPVIARKDTFTYRTMKFVRRHRYGVAAVSVLILSLLGGMLTTIWQARAAQREKAKAENISTFLKQMLAYSNPLLKISGKSGGEMTMKDVLDESTKRLDSEEFSTEPEVKAELERIIGESYFGQGRQDLWEKHMEKYIAIQRSLHAEGDSQTILATATWAMLLEHKDLEKSEKLYRQVLPLMRTEHLKGTIKAQDLAQALNNFGYLRRTQGDSSEAESLFRETLGLSSELPADQTFVVGITRSTLASTLADQGKFEEALQTARQGVTDYRQTGRADAPDFAFSLTVLGGFLTDNEDYAEADKVLSEAESILRERQSSSSLWLGDNLRNQAISLYRQGEYAECQHKIAETEKIYLDSFGPSYDHYPTVLIIKGLILNKTGQSKEGERFLREALKLRVESLPAEHYWIAIAKGALGECLLTQKRYAEAEPLLTESFNRLNGRFGQHNPYTKEASRRLRSLSEIRGKLGEPATAQTIY